MFHLFKRVYLDLDDAIDLNVNRYVISQANGVDILHDLAGVVHSDLIAFARNLDELIGPDKKYANFLLFLNDVNRKADSYNSRIVIYCDRDTFLKLSCKWLKIILPNATPDDAYGLVSSSMFMTRMFGISQDVNFTRPYRQTQIEHYVSPQEFHAQYNTTVVETGVYDGFVSLITPTISFEYLLASYFVNGTHKDIIKNILKTTLKDGAQQYVYEAKAFLLRQLLSNNSMAEECTPTKSYDLGNLDTITLDPAFDIWFDNSLWGVEGVPVAHTSSSQFQFEKLTPSQFQKLKTHLEFHWKRLWLFDDIETLGPRGTIWKNDVFKMIEIVISNQFTDSDLDFVIQTQLSGPIVDPACQFGQVDVSKFNMPLINYITRCVLKDEKHKLNGFVLPI